ncbi:MAG: hypothetical protein H7Y00_14430 [Fimbriimonadaceae bacterium]|nr:hypothetical protein [Chitinophagales bacterium]
MKMKSLFFILCLGLLVASCTDKKAEEEMAKMKKDMQMADSICIADKQMLMDSITSIRATLDSLMMPKNATSSNTSKSGSTKTTTKDDGKSVNDRGGVKDTDTKKDVNERGGEKETDTKKDVNKRGGGK